MGNKIIESTETRVVVQATSIATKIITKLIPGPPGPTPYNPKGAWQSGIEFKAGPPSDVVSHNGSQWFCLINNIDSPPSSSNPNWGLLSSYGSASNIAFTPYGNISSTTIQGALQELDTEKANIANPVFIGTASSPQYISTIANGTAPLVVASNTVVTNLNTDMLDGYHGTDFPRKAEAASISGTWSFTSSINLTSGSKLIGTNQGDLLVSKASGYKSWVMHHPLSDNLVLAPSTVTDGTIWDWSNQITLSAGSITSRQLVSNASTGTAPLVITSTTAVANLNADMVDGYHALDFPRKAEAASVTGAWSFTNPIKLTTGVDTTALKTESAGVLAVRNSADTGYADIKVNNLIVTGTTTTINSETLSIADNFMTLNSNLTTSQTGEDAGIEVNRGGVSGAARALAKLYHSESNSRWYSTIDGNGTASQIINASDVDNLASAGKIVKRGTSGESTSTYFTVNNLISSTSVSSAGWRPGLSMSGGNALVWNRGTDTRTGIVGKTGDSLYIGSSTVTGVGDMNAAAVYHMTVNMASNTINFNTQVGIGIPSPTEALEVGGNAKFTGNGNTIYIKASTGEISSAGALNTYFVTTYHINSGIAGSATSRLSIDNTGTIVMANSGGNVGIGISSPTEKLHVNGKIKATSVDIPALTVTSSTISSNKFTLQYNDLYDSLDFIFQ